MRCAVEDSSIGHVGVQSCGIMDGIDENAFGIPQIECASVVRIECKVGVLPMVIATITADESITLGRNILEMVDGLRRGVVVAIAYTPVAKINFAGSGVIEFEP